MRTVRNGHVLQGVITLLFTPFTADGKRFDAPSMRRQLDTVLDAGVSGVVACGKAGEFEGQTLDEVEEVITTVLEHVDGRVPVGMGIISVELERGLQAADVAARCGADFAMVKKHSKQDIHGFFLTVAERIPVMLYDQTDEGTLDIEKHVLPILEECEQIGGLKVSGNVYSFGQLKAAAPDVPLICGWDTFSLLSYLSGSHGVVAGSAAIMPKYEVALHHLAQAGRTEEARHLFYTRMLPLIAFATPDPYAFSVCKHVLYWQGLIDSPIVRPPYENAPPLLQAEMLDLARQLELVNGQRG